MPTHRYLYVTCKSIQNFTWLLATLATILVLPSFSAAETVEGFLQPNKTIELSPPYRGILSKVIAREGDVVSAGDILAELNSSVLKASMEIAGAKKNSTGELESSKAIVALKKNRLNSLKAVQKKGGVRHSELKRAETDFQVANSQLREVRERLNIASLEYKRLKTQLEERRLRSPINGIILELHAEQSELVEANRETPVYTIAQLDPLVAVFHVSPKSIIKLQAAQEVTLQVIDISPRKISGKIRFISPIIDAQSGTVRVKVELPNPTNHLVSGTRCTLSIP